MVYDESGEYAHPDVFRNDPHQTVFRNDHNKRRRLTLVGGRPEVWGDNGRLCCCNATRGQLEECLRGRWGNLKDDDRNVRQVCAFRAMELTFESEA